MFICLFISWCICRHSTGHTEVHPSNSAWRRFLQLLKCQVQCFALKTLYISCWENTREMLQRANQQNTSCHDKQFRQHDFNNPKCFSFHCYSSKNKNRGLSWISGWLKRRQPTQKPKAWRVTSAKWPCVSWQEKRGALFYFVWRWMTKKHLKTMMLM